LNLFITVYVLLAQFISVFEVFIVDFLNLVVCFTNVWLIYMCAMIANDFRLKFLALLQSIQLWSDKCLYAFVG